MLSQEKAQNIFNKSWKNTYLACPSLYESEHDAAADVADMVGNIDDTKRIKVPSFQSSLMMAVTRGKVIGRMRVAVSE